MRQLQKPARLIRDDQAATAIEYALLAALVAICLLGALQFTAGQTISMWTMIKTQFEAVMQTTSF